MAIEYDALLQKIGGFGRYQKVLLVVLFFPAIFDAMQGFLPNFILAEHKHRPADSVLQEDLTINKDQDKILTPLTATVNRTIKICPTGQTQINSNCVPCPKGTKSSSSQCIDCEVNTYQDETGQNTCKACSGSVMKYTLATGSNSSSQCISICEKTPRYCNFGTCHADQHSQYCTCRDNYEGSRCSSKAEKTSSNTAIIGGAKRADDLERKKFNRTYDMESDAPYRNPMYDNSAYPRRMLAAYPYNWGSDPYDHDPYAPYIAQKQIRAFESDEDYYQPRGTPKESPRRQTHEWHAAAQT
ncbi:unnamed protein product [Mytilus edulis]|uniref:EGF-like domain-containing protein n=1 Tax=Mytilus edulis TaxID=6550 RepID=A0A8S3QKV9_MYTED|nr:unnamed protein product [Mytilus edulis]